LLVSFTRTLLNLRGHHEFVRKQAA
jgi:hypothetical protein